MLWPCLAQAPTAPSLMVWVDREHPNHPNALQTELSINGKPVEIYSREGQKNLDKHLNKGWNTLRLRTFPRGSVKEPNQLFLRFGGTRPGANKNQLAMDPILWELRNGTGWELRDGKYLPTANAEASEAVQSFTLWYAGFEQEPGNLKVNEGDYFLAVQAERPDVVPVTASVSINGTMLNSFVGNRRNVAVTPLLKKGENELKLITHRVGGPAAPANDVKLQLVGPARYNAAKKMHEFAFIRELSSLEDWEQDPQTKQYRPREKPDADHVERSFAFTVEELPGKPGR